MSKLRDEIEWRDFLRRIAEARRRYRTPTKQTTIITKRPLPRRRSPEPAPETPPEGLPATEEANETA